MVLPMRNLTGNLFIISAPSGAGKSSLINALLQRHADMKVSISHTTRAPRPAENDGEHYHFVSKEHFISLITHGEFLEWAEVFGNYYGTARTQIEQYLLQGIDVFLDIDWQGARQIKTQLPSAIGIFILPPSLDVLEKRLQQRQQDSAEVITARMAKAQNEMCHADEYEYLIINDNFEDALTELEHIVLSQRNSYTSQLCRHRPFLEQLLAETTK